MFHLSLTHTLDVLQLIECDGVVSRHLLQRHILEDHIRWALHLLRHFLTQISQHRTQHGVEGTDATFMLRSLFILIKLSILHDHEGVRLLQELLTGSCHLQQTVVLYLFLQITGNQGLTNHWVPYLLILVGTRSEILQLLMMMSQNLIGLLTCDKVYDIVAAEVLLHRQDSLERCHQLIFCFYLRLWMQTVVTVATVVFRIVLSEIVQQHLTTADRGLRIGCCLHQQLSSDVLFCHWLSFHELIEFLQILI